MIMAGLFFREDQEPFLTPRAGKREKQRQQQQWPVLLGSVKPWQLLQEGSTVLETTQEKYTAGIQGQSISRRIFLSSSFSLSFYLCFVFFSSKKSRCNL